MRSQEQRKDRSSARKQFREQGFCVIDDFLTAGECEGILSQIEAFRGEHELKRIQRKVRERSLDYFVIDGDQIAAGLPDFRKIFTDMKELVNELDTVQLVPLANARAAINVNITPPGGEYRWHYDRNRTTSLLYLNGVEGGEIEFYPKYRCKIAPPALQFAQETLDWIFRQKCVRLLIGRSVNVTPAPGRLLVMRGDISLHSVRPVTANRWRFNVVMAYDPPGAVYKRSAELDRYLYDPS